MEELFTIQNEINEYFRWCLVRFSNPVDKHPAIIRNIDRKLAKQHNFKELSSKHSS